MLPLLPTLFARLGSAGYVLGGKYELVRPLGRGSMGEVWVANHRSLGEEVAVKLLAAASGTGQWEDQGAAAPRGLLPLPPRLP